MREHDLLDALADVLLGEAVVDAALLTEATRTTGASRAVTNARARFQQDWMGALGDFHAELLEISDGRDPRTGKTLTAEDRRLALNAAGRRLENRWHDTIETGHLEGWRLGHAFRAARAPDDISAAIRETIDRQRAFASRYVTDLVTGRAAQPGAMGMAARGGMYAETIEGSFHRGAADAGPPGEQIFWKLSPEGLHCVDCPTLAATSPFTKETLPTVPRAGATESVWTPAARILTRRGWVPIVEVVVGDEAWTHRSRWRPVVALRRTEAQENQKRGYLLRGRGGSVGLTADHKVWTLDGWVPIADVASATDVLDCLHAKVLREVFGDDALGSAYESVQSVRGRLLLWEAEGPPGGGVHAVRTEQIGEGAVGEAGEPRPHPGSDPHVGGGPSDGRPALRGSEGGGLSAAEERRPLHRELLRSGGGSATHGLSEHLDVGANPRSGADRLRGAPQERGPDGRPDREPGSAPGGGAPPAPSDAGAARADDPGARRRADGCSDLDVQGLRRGVPGSKHGGAAGALRLLESVCSRVAGEESPIPHLRDLWLQLRGEAERDGAGRWAALLQPGLLPRAGVAGVQLRDVRHGVPAPEGRREEGAPEVLFEQVLPARTVLYDLEVAEDFSFVVEGGFVVANCRSHCKCHLEFRPAPVAAAAPQPPKDKRPLDRALIEPGTAPPGYRVPTDTEAAVLRDLEMRMNHARRQIAQTRGTPEQRDWIQRRKDLNRHIIDFNRARGTYSVPRFRVEDVINGVDVELQDVDRMVMRGIDGTTVHRASAREIQRQLDDAVADLRVLLDELPPDAPAIPNLAAELDRLGAPPVTPPPRPTPPGGPQPVPPAPPPGSRREALAQRSAPAGVALLEDVGRPPVPDGVAVVNVVARSGRQALLAHVEAIRTLAEDGPFAVEVGPADEDWAPLVLGAGTWIRGDVDEVRRFIAAWKARARGADLMEAPWQMHA